MIKSEMPGATWLVETLWHSSGVLDIEYVWQELLPFIWTYIQELQQGAAAWSTFGNKRLQDDGFLPVMDINIMNQAVKGTSKLQTLFEGGGGCGLHQLCAQKWWALGLRH